MQLATYQRLHSAVDRLGVLDGAELVDLTATDVPLPDADDGSEAARHSLLDLLRMGRPGIAWAERAWERARLRAESRHTLDDVRLRAPLPRPNSLRDFMLVEEHVRNSLGEVPDEWYKIPVYWKGNCDTVFGPDETIPWPSYTDKLDYELEVGAIIGRRAYRVSVEEAETCIAGYTIFNDWSARDIQFREMSVGLGPGLGKDFATSLGPCMVTADAIDITTAGMSARVNGEVWSAGTLGGMRFSFPEVVAHLSEEQPLQAGDVLGSGTVGRGCGLEIGRWVQPGDVVELDVEGIGVLRNRVGPRGER